jgi:hypothetical protein
VSKARRPAQTFAQKALARAAGADCLEVGQVVDTRPDVVLSHDNTAAIRKIWMELGQERVAIPERMAVTLDHAVPAPSTAHARNHAEVRRFVREQGVRHFFEVGRGICHQVLSEEALVLPGQLILGADSHTPHFGWMGAFGAGVGRSEVACLWATGELWLRVPESVQVTIDGPVPPAVAGKDIALHLLSRLGADGGLYRVPRRVRPDQEALAALQVGEREHRRPLDHAVDEEPVVVGVDGRDARVMALEVEVRRRDGALQVLQRRARRDRPPGVALDRDVGRAFAQPAGPRPRSAGGVSALRPGAPGRRRNDRRADRAGQQLATADSVRHGSSRWFPCILLGYGRLCMRPAERLS